MDYVFQTFVESIRSDTDTPSLCIAMVELAKAFDLSAFAYLNTGLQPNARANLISNYPTAWTNQYLANEYQEIDPVIDMVRRTRDPFQWGCERWSHQILGPQIQLLEEAAHFGIRCGFTIPIQDPLSGVVAVTFAADDSDLKFASCVKKHQSLLQFVAILFHSRARLAFAPQRSVSGIELSPREYECLKWSAKGKSAWDIGCILNISRRTAAFHLDNAKSKLGVRTISQAVALLAASTQCRL